MPKVLIVEDDPAVRDVVEYALAREGMETETAPSGEAATELLYSDARFDLVILDVMLPDTDGVTLCRELRSADCSLRDVPVIMVTARDDETSVVVGLEVGADDYVTKPFSPPSTRQPGAGAPETAEVGLPASGTQAGVPRAHHRPPTPRGAGRW